MRKKKKRLKLIWKPDYLYASYWMLKFANKFMKSGKKHLVEKNILHGLSIVKEKTRQKTLPFFFHILIKFRPFFGFISKRFGRQFKTIPVPLYPRRQTITSLTWLVTAIKFNQTRPFLAFQSRIVNELIDNHVNKKTKLRTRHEEYMKELYQNRLNHRFRWS